MFYGIERIHDLMSAIKALSFVRFSVPRRLDYCKLFKLLVSRQVPPVSFEYRGNFVRVACCGIVSDYFLAISGVKQGGVLSPVFFVCILMACWWRCPRQELDVSSAIIL